MKLLRTIQLDPSDTFVFERVAEPGEWAVSGAFVFWDTDLGALQGKARAAFRSGFLGVRTLGWSTLVQVTEANEEDCRAAVEALATHLVETFGAPTIVEARTAAEEELAFAHSLCTHPAETLIAVHRRYEDREIREAFRSLRAKPGEKSSLWALGFLNAETEDEEAKKVDLASLGRESRE